MEDISWNNASLQCIVLKLETTEIEVVSVDPITSMMAIENSALAEIAGEIKEKLQSINASL